jgi:ribose transport system substrate-binding protein
MRSSRIVKGVGLVAALALAASACSSSSKTSAGTNTTAAAAAASTTSTTSGGNAQANALLAKYTAVPDASSITVKPLATRPPTGKTVAYINCGVAPCSTQFSPGLHAAGTVLGWTVKDYNYNPSNPVTLESAIESAVNDNVTAIVATAGQPTVTAKGQALAKAKGILYINGFGSGDWTTDPTLAAGLFYGDIRGQFVGSLMAAYLAKQATGGAAVNAALLRVKEFDTVHLPKINGLTAGLQQMCPTCKYSEIQESSAQQIGNQSSGVVISYLQAHPDVNYIIYESGQPAIGIQAALTTAGLASKVKVLGFAPDNPQIAAVKDGSELMWVYDCSLCAGWYFADTIARLLNKESITGDTSTNLPTQVVDKQNLPSVVPAAYNFPTDTDLATKFRQIWQIPG